LFKFLFPFSSSWFLFFLRKKSERFSCPKDKKRFQSVSYGNTRTSPRTRSAPRHRPRIRWGWVPLISSNKSEAFLVLRIYYSCSKEQEGQEMVSIARSATQNALCDALRASWNKSGLRKPCFTVPVSFVSLCPSEPLVTCSCPMLLSCCCLSGLTCSRRRFYLLFRRNKRDERVPSVSGGNIGKWGRVR
jgi:hypothetical protein